MTKNKFQEYRRKSMMGIVWGTLRIWKWIGRIIAFVSNWVFILILSLYGIVNCTYMIQLEGSRFSGTLFHVSILFHLIYPFVLFFNFPIIIAHRRAKLVNKSYCITHEIAWNIGPTDSRISKIILGSKYTLIEWTWTNPVQNNVADISAPTVLSKITQF